MITIETAQTLGLRLKALRKLLEKHSPAALTAEDIAKVKKWSVADTVVLLELAVAADIVTEKTVRTLGDETRYTL